MDFLKTKSIRFDNEDIIKLVVRGLDPRPNVTHEDNFTIVDNVTYALAKRYIDFINLDVKCADWVSVTNGDFAKIEKIYNGEFDAVEAAPEVVEEKTEFVPTTIEETPFAAEEEAAPEESVEENATAQEDEVHETNNQQYSFKKKNKHH